MDRNNRTLIPMVEFVNRINELVQTKGTQTSEVYYIKQLMTISLYAKFLSQPLTLGMFVPCGDDGKPLEIPLHFFSDSPEKENSAMYVNSPKAIEYERAKERVMFEGFELKGRELYHNETNLFWVFTLKDFDMSHINIEQLLNNYKNEMVFTPNALKEIYGI